MPANGVAPSRGEPTRRTADERPENGHVAAAVSVKEAEVKAEALDEATAEGADEPANEAEALDAARRIAESWSAVLAGARTAATGHPDASDEDRVAMVKTVRKATKTGRALVRLLRDAMSRETRDGLERLFGDAASLLSPIRDRDAMVGTVDRLLEGKRDERVQQARELLVSIVAPPPIPDRVGDDQRGFEAALVRRAIALIEVANEVIQDIPADAITGAVVADGMAGLWRNARRRANRDWQQDGEAAHDVRKAALRLVHQLNLIESDLPRPLRKFRQRLRRATSALGDEHDLAILAECIELKRGRLGATFAEAVLSVCRSGRARLREQAGMALVEAMTLKPSGVARLIRKTYRD